MAVHVSQLDVCYRGKYKLNVQYVMYCIHSVYVHAYTYVPTYVYAYMHVRMYMVQGWIKGKSACISHVG